MNSRSTSFYLSLVAILSIVFMPQSGLSKTRVYVQNNTSLNFSYKVKRTGYKLSKKYWRQKGSSSRTGKRQQVLWFNRDKGIKSGKRFYFTTRFTYGGKSVYLRQKLKGKTINSTMWHSLSGPGFKHKWRKNRKTYRASWRIGNRTIKVKYRAFFTGTDDNIEYIFSEEQGVAGSDSNSINILAYNIYMRETNLFKNGQSIRAGLLPRRLSGYDVIIFSEAFDNKVRRKLLRKIKKMYPYRTRILGRKGVKEDGGVIIVSKYRIVYQKQRIFKQCSGSDCLAKKGVMYARIMKQGRRYHIFGTHTQADPDRKSRKIRRSQFKHIRRFIESLKIPKNEPVIIGGDLNVDKIRHKKEYQQMLKILKAGRMRYKGHKYTYDPRTNKLASGKSEYLDYVLYSNTHLRPKRSFNEVRILRSHKEWKEFVWEKAMWDLSDHYPVYGRFEYKSGIRAVKRRR